MAEAEALRHHQFEPVEKTVVTHSESETADAGRDLGLRLSAGAIVLLFGDLGAGKTAFVRGMAEGLGNRPDEVSSPTFTLMQEYRGGRVPVLHVDLYRLDSVREIEELGLEELSEDSVLAVEWANKLDPPPRDAVHVTIEHAGDTDRRVTIVTPRT